MSSVRAFVAIELPEEVRMYLAKIQSSLRQMLAPVVRWVEPQGVHLTLKFLGGVEASRLPKLEGCVAGATGDSHPFSLTVEGLGCFPNRQQPRVLWVGLQGQLEQLVQLQRAVETALRPMGFPSEDRAFSPHLTLGRLRDEVSREERRRVGEVVASLEVGAGPAFDVTSISLIRSQLTSQGAVYSGLATMPLAAGGKGHPSA